MGRYKLAAMSLVTAIPAAVLAYFSIMAWVSFAENMSTMLKIVNGALTPISVLVALMPVIILVGRRRPKSEGSRKGEEAASGAAAAAAEGSEEAPVAAGTGELVDVADSEQMPSSLSDSEMEQSETDAFDFEAADLDDADSEPAEFEEENEK